MIDLSSALYVALNGDPTIASGLASYDSALAIFTRRPVPGDAPFPMIVSAGEVTVGDEDLLNNPVPVLVRDVGIFGQQDADDVSKYRTVESLAYAVRDLFHRQRSSIAVAGWNVIDIRASGPIVGPTDDDTTVQRIVTLTIRLSQA